MRHVLLSLAALLVSTFLLYLGNGMIGTLLVLRMAAESWSEFLIGLVMAGYFAGQVVGAFYAYNLIASVGHIRGFTAFASVMSATVLAYPFLVTPLTWVVLRVVQGFCIAGLAMCTESWLNERATNELRGRTLSLYMLAIYLALGGGQQLLNLDDSSGYGLFILVSILVSVALVPVAVSKARAPGGHKPERLAVRALYRITPVGIVGALMSGAITGAFLSLAPLFTQKSGLDTAHTADFMTAAILGGLILQWPIGRASDRTDRRIILVGVFLGILAASLAMTGPVLDHPLLLLGLAALVGGLIITLYPLAISHANDHLEPQHMVSATGTLLLLYGVGASLSPLAASLLMGPLGPDGLFVFMAILAAAGAGFVFWRIGRRQAVPEADRLPYQAMPRTSPLVGELDPRADDDQYSFPFMDEMPWRVTGYEPPSD
ncbi:MAG: MFS transporter [Rhodobacterales bacterium]|nr:MFS transporter [Rhodobacterales bacterium]